MRNQPHDAGGRPHSGPVARGGPPRHVVVASAQNDITWGVFHAFEQLSQVRVTGCSSMTQARYVCALDPPQVIVFDMRLLDDDPLGLVKIDEELPLATAIC